MAKNKIPPKNITLRAFRFEEKNISNANSGILKLLKKVLSPQCTAAQRRMPLNADEPDRDLLANYTWAPNNSYIFGMMLRIIPADNGGVISEKLFNQPTITMAQINAGNPNQSQYKDHFYFALNNDYLVTNLSQNVGIERLQTYLNWLLESVRDGHLFQLTELTKLPQGVQLSQIKEIQFVGGSKVLTAPTVENEQPNITQKLENLAKGVMETLMSDRTSEFGILRANQLIEARLLIKFKGKPKNMAQNEFQRVMGALATNVTNDNGIIIRTKDGNKYTGSDVKMKKSISVESLGPNRLVEEQLKQEMELFLNEVRAQQNE